MYYGSTDEKTAFEKVKSGEWTFEEFQGYIAYVKEEGYDSGYGMGYDAAIFNAGD